MNNDLARAYRLDRFRELNTNLIEIEPGKISGISHERIAECGECKIIAPERGIGENAGYRGGDANVGSNWI